MKIEEAMEFWQSQKPVGRQQGKDLWQTIAIALEKQIPKKPIKSADTYEQYRCPVCDTCVGIWDLQHKTVIKENHCQNCGQKIMWEEEDED